MSQVCRIKEVAPQRLVVGRSVVAIADWGDALSTLLADVWSHLNRYESVTVGPAMARLTDRYDERIEIEAGFPIGEPVEPAPPFAVSLLPAGRAATLLHEGPYQRLAQAHATLTEWTASQQLTPSGAPWLIFWATPDDVDIPADLRTELVWLLNDRAD